jgi:hypothetical protein
MLLFKDSVKHRSLRLWPAILTAAAFFAAGSLTTGCIIIDEDDDEYHHTHYVEEQPPVEEEQPPPGPTVVSIDTDQTLDAKPGEGVGLMIEYTSGGVWRLWTTCDTLSTDTVCRFDAFAKVVDPKSALLSAEGQDLEGVDIVELISADEAHLKTETASDVDAMQLTATPGATLRLEVYLDGVPDGRFVYWMGDGIVHTGAPSNPLDITPTTP